MVGTKPSTTTPVPPPACPTINEITFAIQNMFDAQTQILASKLAEIDARLNDLANCKPIRPSEVDMGAYENLTIFDDWKLIYNKPYSHCTSSNELLEAANSCHSNRVVVGAKFKENSTMLNVAAVGPKRVLFLNATYNNPEEIENVLWYREPGRNFGFQTNGNSLDGASNSERILSWSIDTTYGGWRAGKITNLYDSSIWYKVIYCMTTIKE